MGYIFDKFTEIVVIVFAAVGKLIDIIAIPANKENQ